MLYNFRIDREKRSTLIKRIKKDSVLSQGWGGGKDGGLSLLDIDNFKNRVQQRYDLKTTRIPTNLMKIRSFKDSDIIIVPHLPINGTFSIHIVEGDFPNCYTYLENDDAHLNHTIKLKEPYGLEGNLSLYNAQIAAWKGKLQWMRLPILPINKFKSDFDVLINELRDNPEKEFQKSDLQEYLEKLQNESLDFIKGSLAKISPSGGEINFEAVCELILANQGYSIAERNMYDGEGGDVDLVCVKDRSNISPFEEGEETLYVQIKKHKGTSNKDGIDQLLNMIEKTPGANGCLISLADHFTDNAIKIAEKEGVVLINGRTVSELLMSVMINKV